MSDSLSVVIPCYNAARYVVAAVRSALAQNVADLDVIVIDDGSSDGSGEVLAREFPGIRVIRQANAGVAAARNHGIAQARGEWIAFLDADDIWLPGKIATQFEALRAEPLARMAYGAWQVWPSDEPEPAAAYIDGVMATADDAPRWAGPSGWIYPRLLLDCEVWTSTVLAHRSLFEEIGTFDAGLRIGEDYDLWLRASRVTPILRAARPLALYRMHPASITRSAPAANYRGIVIERALQRWGYAHAPAGSASPRHVRRALSKSWSDYAMSNLEAGQLSRARSAATMSLRADPTHIAAWKGWLKAAVWSLRGPGEVQP